VERGFDVHHVPALPNAGAEGNFRSRESLNRAKNLIEI
jgi:hypothetical protein